MGKDSLVGDRDTISVLLVEADASASARLASGLRRTDGPRFAVRAATADVEAVAILGRHDIDAIVLTGEPAASRVQALRACARDPVIVVCASGHDVTEPGELLAAGAQDCVPHGAPDAIGYSIQCCLLRQASDEAAHRLVAIVDSLEDAIIGTSLDGTITSWNRTAERMYGYGAEEVIGRSITILAGDEAQHAEFGAILARVARGEAVTQTATTRRLRTGEVLRVSISVSPIHDRSGRIVGASTVARDRREPSRSETRSRDAEARFRKAFDNAPIGMAILSDDGRIEQANAALGAICGVSDAELEGGDLRRLVSTSQGERLNRALREILSGRDSTVEIELRVIRSAGSAVYVCMTGTRLPSADGEPPHILCQVQDITQRRSHQARLQFMADHDPLTGLLNRRRFEEELARHLSQIARYGPEGAVLVLDVDRFKQINDSWGHDVGDRVLVSVAGALRDHLRRSDVLARLGGDEFAVLLPKADPAQAATTARLLAEAVSRAGGPSGGPAQRTVSVGVAMLDEAGDCADSAAMVDADQAMYEAKAAGGDGYAVFGESQRQRQGRARQLSWATRVETALRDDSFVLFGQPILNLRTAAVRGYELFVRMLDTDGSLIEPAQFLHAAERHALIERLDGWVAARAVQLLQQHPDTTMFVNISGKSMASEGLLDDLEEGLREASVDPQRLVVEVNETAAIANFLQAEPFIARLRDVGCRFALDDFGAGFGSFYYLKHLAFDYLKIDGEFVAHLASDGIDRLIVEAVVGVARALGTETIGEFVGTDTTRRKLSDLGVDHAQGYHIGMPQPIADVLAPAAAGPGNPL
jgi:diguanylate cyclase (GGDEF)-like protein/PAS domain S-box-containing protein